MPNIEFYVITSLVIVIALQTILWAMERASIRKTTEKERRDMMNRIMAKNYGEYLAGNRSMSVPPGHFYEETKIERPEGTEPEDDESGDGRGIPVG